jgi:hypothetical protein
VHPASSAKSLPSGVRNASRESHPKVKGPEMTMIDIAGDAVEDALTSLREHVAAPVALPGERVYERPMAWNVAVPVQPGAVVWRPARRTSRP